MRLDLFEFRVLFLISTSYHPFMQHFNFHIDSASLESQLFFYKTQVDIYKIWYLATALKYLNYREQVIRDQYRLSVITARYRETNELLTARTRFLEEFISPRVNLDAEYRATGASCIFGISKISKDWKISGGVKLIRTGNRGCFPSRTLVAEVEYAPGFWKPIKTPYSLSPFISVSGFRFAKSLSIESSFDHKELKYTFHLNQIPDISVGYIDHHSQSLFSLAGTKNLFVSGTLRNAYLRGGLTSHTKFRLFPYKEEPVRQNLPVITRSAYAPPSFASTTFSASLTQKPEYLVLPPQPRPSTRLRDPMVFVYFVRLELLMVGTFLTIVVSKLVQLLGIFLAIVVSKLVQRLKKLKKD